MSVKSPLIRLAPLQFEDLPSHPSFGDDDTNKSRPDLLAFALTVLDQGRSLVLPTNFNLTFKSHSWKPSPPSNNEVEILSAEVPSSSIESISWSSPTTPRPKPAKIHDEHWYARRSYHHNVSVKRNAPGTASFEEFTFGLRDNKSEHEKEFTSDLYDAHYICDWNEQLAPLLSNLVRPSTSTTSGSSNNNNQHNPSISTNPSPNYSSVTMSIYENCHKLPSPAAPRCFPVLVLTASVSPEEFIAVTLPVNISTYAKSFYSSNRNHKEGTDHQTRKSVTIANYVAVERVHKYSSVREHAKDGAGGKVGREHSRGDSGEEIEWIMATASRAKGNIPMAVQRMGVPGAIAKDVGMFLKWIRNVPDEVIRGTASGSGSGTRSTGVVQGAGQRVSASGDAQ